MEYGEIYCLTSPSGKKYIGQCVKYLINGRKWGFLNRWKQHICESNNNKDYSRALNNSIRKYGSENFKVELIKECKIDEMNYYENQYILEFNTITPNGYNLTTGGSNGRQSIETRELKSKSMIGKNKNRLLNKRPRIREEDNNLPKYLRYYKDNTGKEGYRISNHPSLICKSFLSKKLTLEKKLELAMEYLNNVNKADIR